jgi:hypothetical protein
MRQARCLIVATLVAAALCADRSVAAAPSIRPETVPLAQRLVNRLSVSFKRVAPVARFFAEQQAGPALAVVNRSPSLSLTLPARQPVSPFQFRLPPPAV